MPSVVERWATMPARPVARTAGLATRCAAAVLDLVVVLVTLAGVYAAIAAVRFLIGPRSFHWPSNLGWTVPVVGEALAVTYLTIAWSSSGRTVGCAALGLRLESRRRARVRPAVAALRAVLYLLLPIGLFWIPFSRGRYSLQDVLVGTRVAYDWTNISRPAPRPGRGSDSRG